MCACVRAWAHVGHASVLPAKSQCLWGALHTAWNGATRACVLMLPEAYIRVGAMAAAAERTRAHTHTSNAIFGLLMSLRNMT